LPAAEGLPSGRREDRDPAAVPAGTETILIAEDEEVLRTLTTLMLEDRGYNVIAAETPQHALHLVEEGQAHIDLLLTDLVMPKMGGRVLADRIREQNPNVRVLFMSGYADDSHWTNDGPQDGAALLEKPFSSADLARRVREILDEQYAA
jgi:two-component system cell cycle sensor histidine kinase/response regulator CckA